MARARDAVVDSIVRALAIKGSAPLDALGSALLSDPIEIKPIVDQLVRGGQAERVSGAIRLTRNGKTRGRKLFAADREQWGVKNATAALEAFHELDERMKETITAWQLRDLGGTQVPNDHRDRIYDARVMARLTELHHDTNAWVDSMTGAPTSIRDYVTRLEKALKSARSDPRFMASPLVDSYHGVWFEFHEALIQLAGRTRAEESAAGRA
jgi:hypothetical protein